jgi:hypothetical protein
MERSVNGDPETRVASCRRGEGHATAPVAVHDREDDGLGRDLRDRISPGRPLRQRLTRGSGVVGS